MPEDQVAACEEVCPARVPRMPERASQRQPWRTASVSHQHTERGVLFTF